MMDIDLSFFAISGAVALTGIIGCTEEAWRNTEQENSISGNHAAAEETISLESDGWALSGTWTVPERGGRVPAVLLLHKSATDRHDYDRLARDLAERGLASFRLDLRAHGESVNLGAFVAPYPDNVHLIEETYKDVNVALAWMKARPEAAPGRLGVVGASYTGEAVGEALRAGGDQAAAYVMISPGSFSQESIDLIDQGSANWLFVRTTEEGPGSRVYIDAIFEALEEQAMKAQLREIPGAGHATRIFDEHPFIVEEIADWLAAALED